MTVTTDPPPPSPRPAKGLVSDGSVTGRRGWQLGPLQVMVDTRAAVVTALLLVVSVGAVFVVLGTGVFPVGPGGVIRAALDAAGLAQGEPTDAGTRFAIIDIGLPRALAGILVGACLGASGALVQALTRNRLGSPDILGFDSGAAAGALFAILVLGLPASLFPLFAVLGATVAAMVVFAFARGGSQTGLRIILIGIGLGAMLDSVSSYLITRSSVEQSQTATRWLVGSLSQTTWGDVVFAATALPVLLVAATLAARQLRVALLGDDTATSLGVRLPWLTPVVLLVAVSLSAVAVLAAGPISFVALTAPQIALRLTGGRRDPEVLPAAAMGALILTVSDLIGQRLLPSTDLPVGIVTGAVGGLYLAWLLAGRRRRA